MDEPRKSEGEIVQNRCALRAALWLLPLTVAATWPLVTQLGSHLPHTPGDPLLNAWILAFGSGRILHGDWSGLFQGNIHYPLPNTLALSEHLYGVSLVLWPIWALTRDPVLLYNLAFLLARWLSGVGMYLLAYELTRHRGAAFLAAVVFAFCPFQMGRLAHLQMQMNHPTPFGLWFLVRFLRGRRLRDWLLFLGFSLWQALSCYYLFFAYALGAGLLYAWALIHRAVPPPRPRLVLLQLASLALAAALLYPFAAPYLEAHRQWGIEAPFEDNVAASARLQDFLNAPPQNRVYGEVTRRWDNPRLGWEKYLFPGLLPAALLLALPVLWLRRRQWPPWEHSGFVLLFLAGAVLALGPVLQLDGSTLPLPYAALYHWLPGFKSMRVPARMSVLCYVGLAVACALSLKALAGTRRWPSVLACCVVFLEYFSAPLPLFRVPNRDEIPEAYRWLARQPGELPVFSMPCCDNSPRVGGTKQGYWYEYFSIFHGKRIVNGTSGYLPRPIGAILDRLDDPAVPMEERVSQLRDLGVRILVLHTVWLGEERTNAIADELSRLGLQPAARFQRELVYRLEPAPPSPEIRMPASPPGRPG